MKPFRRTLIATLLSCSLVACSAQESVEDYISQAKTHLEKNELGAALISLKNAVSADEQNVAARLMLGQLQLNHGSLLNAEKDLEKALSLNSDNKSVVPYLAQSYLILGKQDKLDKLLLIAGLSEQERLPIIAYAGISALQTGQREKAESLISRASFSDESSPYALLASAWLKFYEKEWPAALSKANQVLERDPELTYALALKGHIRTAQNEPAKAVENYDNYINAHKKHAHIRFYLANSLLAMKDLERASREVDQLLKAFPNHPTANQFKAQVEYLQNNYEAAKLHADKAIQPGSKNIVPSLISGFSAFHQQEFEQSYRTLLAVSDKLEIDHPARKLLARLQIALGYIDEATVSFNQLEDLAEIDSQLLRVTSANFVNKGYVHEANDLIARAVKERPEDADLKVQQGMLKLLQNDQSGMDDLRRALELAPDLDQANRTLALQYVTQGDFGKALDVARHWQTTDSGKVQGKVLEGVILTQNKQYAEAISLFARLSEQDPGLFVAPYYEGIALAALEKPQQARDKLKAAIELNPSHFGALNVLSRLNANDGRLHDTLKYLEQKLSNNPNSIALIVTYAMNLQMAGEVDQSVTFLNKHTETGSDSPHFWNVLSSGYLRQREFAKAESSLDKALAINPQDLGLWFKKLAITMSGDKSKAHPTIQAALKHFPDDVRLRLLDTEMLIERGELTSAKARLESLAADPSIDYYLEKLRGKLALKSRNYSEASNILAKVYQSDPSTRNVLNYAQAVRNHQGLEQAIEVLQSHLDSQGETNSVVALLAEYSIASSPELALQRYHKVLSEKPNSAPLLNNIAWLELKLGKTAEALKHAAKAMELAPDNVSIMDTYASALLASNDIKKGLSVLEKANNRVKSDNEIRLHYAEALAAAGNRAKAKKVLGAFSPKTDELKSRSLKLRQQIETN